MRLETANHLWRIVDYMYWEEWKDYRQNIKFDKEKEDSLDWSNVRQCMEAIDWKSIVGTEQYKTLTNHIFFHLYHFCDSEVYWEMIETRDKANGSSK